MKPKKIAHIGIAVEDLDETLKIFSDLFGLECKFRKVIEEQQIEVAGVDIGESSLEFFMPLTRNSTVGRFIEKKGPGLHHIAFEVDSIKDWIEKLEKDEVKIIDKKPRKGASNHLISFLHPKSTGGILIELEEY